MITISVNVLAAPVKSTIVAVGLAIKENTVNKLKMSVSIFYKSSYGDCSNTIMLKLFNDNLTWWLKYKISKYFVLQLQHVKKNRSESITLKMDADLENP